MYKFSSAYCLEMMGIPIWHLNKPLPLTKQTADFDVYDLYDMAAKKIGKLCLEKLPLKPEQQKPVFRLLDAMLAAIKLKRLPVQDLAFQPEDALIIMGEALAQKALHTSAPLDELRVNNLSIKNHLRVLVTYHPLILLIEPAHKAKAWEDLKKYTHST